VTIEARLVKGKFITIEGGEGAGKSTNIPNIELFLQNEGIEYILTREPGGTQMAEEIRKLLLSPRKELVSGVTELLLMFAARSQHVEEVIKPALECGKYVLCDRFIDATYAYQGGGRNLNSETIRTLERLVLKDIHPDLTILFDIDPAAGLQRARTRGELDRFESEELDFFGRVRAAYLEIAKSDPMRCAIIDGSKSQDIVAEELNNILRIRLSNDI
jgi:dTMP kinase